MGKTNAKRDYNLQLSGDYLSFVRSCNARRIPVTLGEKHYAEICKRPCAYCGGKRETRPSEVRIFRDGQRIGFTLENTEAVCAWCSKGKGDFSRKQFVQLIMRQADYVSKEHSPEVAKVEKKEIKKKLKKEIEKITEEVDDDDDEEMMDLDDGDDDDGSEVTIEREGDDNVYGFPTKVS